MARCYSDLHENGVCKIHVVLLVDTNIQLINVVPENLFFQTQKLIHDKVTYTFYIETFLYLMYMWQPQNFLGRSDNRYCGR